jgi:uncharacterized protein YqhQ
VDLTAASGRLASVRGSAGFSFFNFCIKSKQTIFLLFCSFLFVIVPIFLNSFVFGIWEMLFYDIKHFLNKGYYPYIVFQRFLFLRSIKFFP